MAEIPVEFLLFAVTLLGVALWHHRTLEVAAAGLVAITAHKLLFGSFRGATGLDGLAAHLSHEWVILANLACLLLGFALLSRHFENSRVPDSMPAILPDGWHGGLALLAVVFVLSAFLDNISAALIGWRLGGAGQRYRVATFLTLLLLTLAITAIVDLDRPRSGNIMISQKPLVDARAQMR